MQKEHQFYEWLETSAYNLGAAAFGVAEIDAEGKNFLLSPAEYDGLHRGVSVGVRLSPDVLAGVEHEPTLLYKWHYTQANNLLDRIAFRLAQSIVQKGYRVLPIPASQIVDWESQRGHLSHRSLAEAAGLGWRGKNNLLVTEAWGAQIRLVSLLTDLPLRIDKPVESRCGACFRCVNACPVHALGDSPSQYRLDVCLERLKQYAKIRGIGQYICGICVKACDGSIE